MKKIIFLTLLVTGMFCDILSAAPRVTEESTTIWRRPFREVYAGLGKGVIINDREIVVRSGQYITAYKSKDGTYLWKVFVGDLPLSYGPVRINEKRLGFIVNEEAIFGQIPYLYCMLAETHQVEWKKKEDVIYPDLAGLGKYIMYQAQDEGRRCLVARHRKGGHKFYSSKTKYYYKHMVPCGNVILADRRTSRLYAIDPEKGREVWDYSTNGILRSSSIYHDGRILVNDGSGRLHCFDPATRKPQWVLQVGGDGTIPPVAVGRRVYAMTAGGVLSAIDIKTSNVLWILKTGSRALVAPGCTPKGLIVPLENGLVLGVDANAGRVLWEINTNYQFTVPPVVHRKLVFLCGNAGTESKMYAFDTGRMNDNLEVITGTGSGGTPTPPQAQTVEPLWHHEFGNFFIGLSPAVADRQNIYFTSGVFLQCFSLQGKRRWKRQIDIGSYSKVSLFESADTVLLSTPVQQGLNEKWKIMAFSKMTGEQIWDAAYASLGAGLLVHNNRVYYAAGRDAGGNRFISRDIANGSIMWQVNTHGAILHYPVFHRGSVICIADASVISLDAATGAELWKTPCEPGLDAGLSVEGDFVIAAGTNGAVYQINTGKPDQVVRIAMETKPNMGIFGTGHETLFAASSGRIYSYHAAGRKIVWQLNTPSPLVAPPVYLDGYLYACASDRRMYIIDVSRGNILDNLKLPVLPEAYGFTGKGGVLIMSVNQPLRNSELHVYQSSLSLHRDVPPPGGGDGSGTQIDGYLNLAEVRSRLRGLKELYDDNLVPREIYDKKVQEILDKYIR
ncbi:PQQ-binding-like beta-propeller repeat protein [Planctomycetota bacterium]